MIKDAMVANRSVWKSLMRSQVGAKKEKNEKLDSKRTKISKEEAAEESQRTKECRGVLFLAIGTVRPLA